MQKPFAMALFLALALSCPPSALAEKVASCSNMDSHFSEEAYSQAIQSINQCLSEGDLSSETYGCLLMKRGRAYFEMGQPDKSGGDVESAIKRDPDLSTPDNAAACLGVSTDKATSILGVATNK